MKVNVLVSTLLVWAVKPFSENPITLFTYSTFMQLLNTKNGFFFADVSWATVPGKVAGEVKLSILYKSEKLFIMVMHIRGLVSIR